MLASKPFSYCFQFFDGNTDRNTIVTIDFDPPVLGQYIRIHPTKWGLGIGLRVEFVGCTQEEQFYCK